MAEQVAVDVKTLLLESETFGMEQAEQIRAALNADPDDVTRSLREAVAQLQERVDDQQNATATATRVRLGVAEYFLSRNAKAVEHLEGGESEVAAFYRGRALLAQRKFDEAEAAFKQAAKAGADEAACTLQRAEALRGSGKLNDAQKLLEQVESAAGETAEFLYQKGCYLQADGDDAAARELFERAVATDGDHVGAVFALAYANDMLGNDEEAIDLYERATKLRPLHVGALLNLGVLYEDTHRYDRAADCYRRILQVYPNHPRARLFLKDTEASHDMYYDEEAERRHDRLSQILEIPVTDFELSVRSRNCLKRIHVRTLGDLTQATEQDLLGSKNFGETSLQEIKDMMASKGLRLGQALEEPGFGRLGRRTEELTPQEQATMARPISDLGLSVRARKCMTKLDINTVGDLIQRTGDELLECKNFGVTSLNEVREKLDALGLKLRGE
jgi:DNA-directed RNA polymerase subunit alpha